MKKICALICIILLMPICADGTEPQLKIAAIEENVVIRVQPDGQTGLMTLYASTRLPTTGAKEVVATIPRNSSGLTLRRPMGDSNEFYWIETNDYQLPETMIWLPPGQFIMGSPETEMGRYPDEGPQFLAKISESFWLSKFEVTQREYGALMFNDPSSGDPNPTAPVETVTWDQANDFCVRLTEQELSAGRLPPGYVYRLPTEAEWEYACRAGTQTRYSYGDPESLLSKHGWWAANGGSTPHNVGEKLPNPWGFYDMMGNVFEWCLDVYAPYLSRGTDPLPSRKQVVRGGAFYCPARLLRCAARVESAPPEHSSWLIGFRVALGKPMKDSPGPMHQVGASFTAEE